jgi:N-acetylglutamate synthase-like GNAT family acetyltransferase
MTSEYLIRQANRDDAKGIHKVLLAAFEEYRHHYTPEGFSNTVMSEDAVKERMKEMVIYVAVGKKRNIIGTIGWQKIDEKEGHIRGMAVYPDWQGKKSPAAALLNTIEDDARSKGCLFLTLDTTVVLRRAGNFYRKHGFKKTGKTDNFFGSKIYEYSKHLKKESR